MKLIVGLGNPGKEYTITRHNAGFIALDFLISKYGYQTKKEEFNAEVFYSSVNGEKVFFLKPLTFMNRSGDAIKAFMNYYKISLGDVLIIYDEKDFMVGKAQFKLQGSSAGHNGIKSIISNFQTQSFKRLRLGIGQPQGNWTLVDWVLSRFNDQEYQVLEESIQKVSGFLDEWTVDTSFEKIMSQYNNND